MAEGLALTGADGTVDDGTEPGLDDPQPPSATSATSATSAAAVTEKRLFMSSRTPNLAIRLRFVERAARTTCSELP